MVQLQGDSRTLGMAGPISNVCLDKHKAWRYGLPSFMLVQNCKLPGRTYYPARAEAAKWRR
jgi:hypothetical protein